MVGFLVAVTVTVTTTFQLATSQYVPAIPRSGLYPFFNTSSSDPSEWTGFEIDMLNWMCNVSGEVLGTGVDNTPILDCAPKDSWVVGDFAEVFQALDNGTADFVIGLITRSDEREAMYNFVKPFYYDSGAALYVQDANSNLTFESLRGKPVCAVKDYVLNQNNVLKDVFGVSKVVSLATSREAVQQLKDGACVAMVGGEVGRLYGESLGLSIVGNSVYQDPIGILTNKNASKDLMNDLSVGLVSMMWAGAASEILKYENETIVAAGYPANARLAQLVSSITGLDTKNGNNLTWSPTTPVFNGRESLNSSSTPTPVTLLMYTDARMPLASIQGNATFLEENSTWVGMEVEIGKAICASPYFACQQILTTNNLDDRLTYLDQGLADISIGEIVVTQSRLDNYSFVQPMYFSAGPAVYVNQSVTVQEPLPGMEYVNGKTICTVYGEAYNDEVQAAGATLIYYNTTQEATQGVNNGECDGFLWDSNVSFEKDGLMQAADLGADYPIGIAISPKVQYSVYSALAALMVELLNNYPDSDLVRWSKEYAAGAYPNSHLYASSNSVSNFVLKTRSSESNSTIPAAAPSTSAPGPSSSGSIIHGALWVSALCALVLLS